ncbi:hypothetical protein [Bradyrhizobium lablabi]|nr:hypothetical protein [Bradyrhizobium lablabi]
MDLAVAWFERERPARLGWVRDGSNIAQHLRRVSACTIGVAAGG